MMSSKVRNVLYGSLLWFLCFAMVFPYPQANAGMMRKIIIYKILTGNSVARKSKKSRSVIQIESSYFYPRHRGCEINGN